MKNKWHRREFVANPADPTQVIVWRKQWLGGHIHLELQQSWSIVAHFTVFGHTLFVSEAINKWLHPLAVWIYDRHEDEHQRFVEESDDENGRLSYYE